MTLSVGAAVIALLGTLVPGAPMLPQAYGAQIDLQVSPRSIVLRDSVSLKIHQYGAVTPSEPVNILVAPAPFNKYVHLQTPVLSPEGAVSGPLLFPTNRPAPGGDGNPDRNFRVYVTDASGQSANQLVYVLPAVSVSLMRSKTLRGPTGPDGPYVVATYQAEVHQMRRYPSPIANFYHRSKGQRRYVLFAKRRLRVHMPSYVGEYLSATARFRDNEAGRVYACVARPIVSDMGPQVTDRSCGKRILR